MMVEEFKTVFTKTLQFTGYVESDKKAKPLMQTVLIVDDETSFLDIFQVILRRAGYKTLVTADGLEGLKLIYDQRPDLVVLDDMLPGMSGSEICARIKRDAAVNNIPVILYSAGPRIRDREFVKQIGANAVMNKPFRPTEAIKLIGTFLGAAV
jgi:two-component system phosphate regulon response regulator PhoB